MVEGWDETAIYRPSFKDKCNFSLMKYSYCTKNTVTEDDEEDKKHTAEETQKNTAQMGSTRKYGGHQMQISSFAIYAELEKKKKETAAALLTALPCRGILRARGVSRLMAETRAGQEGGGESGGHTCWCR